MKLFVLGSPRSGTTVIGNFIASHPQCCNLGEYYGFYLALQEAQQLMSRMPTPVKERYFHDLLAATVDCAEAIRTESGKTFWCDQTPWNMLVVSQLAAELPDAVFLLMLRDYRGVVLSLRRSFAAGYPWAGWRVQESAKLWSRFYSTVEHLPADRTIFVSYDRLCEHPEATIEYIETEISRRFDLDPSQFDRSVLATSHASSGNRKTIAHVVDGVATLASMPAYDANRWSEAMAAACAPHVSGVDGLLRARLGEFYKPVEATAS